MSSASTFFKLALRQPRYYSIRFRSYLGPLVVLLRDATLAGLRIRPRCCYALSTRLGMLVSTPMHRPTVNHSLPCLIPPLVAICPSLGVHLHPRGACRPVCSPPYMVRWASVRNTRVLLRDGYSRRLSSWFPLAEGQPTCPLGSTLKPPLRRTL